MDWRNPQALFLILPLCAGWLLLVLYSDRRRQRAREAFAAQAMWDRLLPEKSAVRFWLKVCLQELAIITGLIALAGPQFGNLVEQVVPRGSDLYVLIDVSRSMLATDVPPSRLERARADVSSLVNRLQGERIGLIAFAGQAVVKCPLTVDYDSFRRALNELDPDSAPRGGTAIGDAIRKALEVFSSRSGRDQAVLLITDGDDQESYPLEAATVAAEQKVTVFTVGLGDSDKGSRVPEKGNPGAFVEHDGQQVWSKLDSKLLQEIALRTSGVYIPAGTRAYDLGELYINHLQGKRGDENASQQRIRKAERFQIFLAICLFAIVADFLLSPWRPERVPQQEGAAMIKPTGRQQRAMSANSTNLESDRSSQTSEDVRNGNLPPVSRTGALVVLVAVFVAPMTAGAGDSHQKVREGLRLYQQEKFEEAGKEFAAAAEELDREKSDKAAIAAFDEACAFHRKGDHEKARDRYLKAGLSPDRTLAVAAHFNLGNLAAEKARSVAGERPEEVAEEKRQEIVDQLKQAIASYRHCVELQPNHVPSRRNLELLRNWMKYYSDRWRERDLQKRREETSLLQFLEFLIQAQTSLREAAEGLPDSVPANMYAELKREQDQLGEEIPTLREKIASELRPDPQGQSAANGPSAAGQPGNAAGPSSKEIEESIALLQGWADKAQDKMAGAGRQLGRGERADAVAEQDLALAELDRIWDAIVPFHPLLAKELADQTALAESLRPQDDSSSAEAQTDSPAGSQERSGADPKDVTAGSGSVTEGDAEAIPLAETTASDDPSGVGGRVTVDDSTLKALAKTQERVLHKARLLAPKAQAELQQFESMPQPETASAYPAATPDANAGSANPADAQAAGTGPEAAAPVDPEKVRAGYQKAIELGPQAVAAMELAVEKLRQNAPIESASHAETARKILEEIQNAQPKNEQPQQQDPQQQDQEKKDPENKDQGNEDKDNKDQEQKQNDSKSAEKKSADEKSKEKSGKEDLDKKNPDPQKSSGQKQAGENTTESKQMSKDRIEEALRRVRERQQEKHERDRAARLRVPGRAAVDRDW